MKERLNFLLGIEIWDISLCLLGKFNSELFIAPSICRKKLVSRDLVREDGNQEKINYSFSGLCSFLDVLVPHHKYFDISWLIKTYDV